MDFDIFKGDKSMLETTQTEELSCKSTRETAKILQVSLGTIQKMVETGELIAWKTRGGHRRILDLSIQRQLSKRLDLLRHFCSKNYSILGVFSQSEDILTFENHCKDLESGIRCHSFLDISEALMAAVELKPEIIFVDPKISALDQYHLIHQLDKNTVTKQIPIMIHQDSIHQLPHGTDYLSSEANTQHVLSPSFKGRIYKYVYSIELLESVVKNALLEKLL